MRHLRISSALYLGVVMLVGLVIAIAAMSVYSAVENTRALTRIYEREVIPQDRLITLIEDLQSVRFQMVAVLSEHTSYVGSRNRVREARTRFESLWREFKVAGQHEDMAPRSRQLIDEIERNWPLLPPFLSRLDGALAHQQVKDIRNLATLEWPLIHRSLLKPLEELSAFQKDDVRTEYLNGIKLGQRIVWVSALIALSATIIGLSFSWWLVSHLRRSLALVGDTLRKAAAGDLTARVKLNERDEIGEIARALDLTLQMIRQDREIVDSLRRENEIILNTVGDAIYGVDAAGRLTFVNPAMERMIGWKAADIIGKSVHALVHHTRSDGSPFPHDDCPLYQAYLAGRPCGLDNEKFWRRDGSSFDVECTTTPIREGEVLVGQVAVFRDISNRKRDERALLESMDALRAANQKLESARQQLVQSEKLASIGQLAAGVAHEINNPIGFVSSNLGTLEKYADSLFALVDAYQQAKPALAAHPGLLADLQAAEQQADLAYLRGDLKALISESRDGTQRVRKIVQDLKNFAHMDAEDVWVAADLHQGLESTLSIVHNELKYKCELVKEYGQLPAIECIPSQLNQVFMNMLVNAGHAIADKGTVTIRTGSEGNRVWVDIIDTGKGIAPEHLNRIFDPFFTTKPIGKGTGLGLSISYGVVKKHGGDITVQSTLGEGTSFRVWLPVCQVATAQ